MHTPDIIFSAIFLQLPLMSIPPLCTPEWERTFLSPLIQGVPRRTLQVAAGCISDCVRQQVDFCRFFPHPAIEAKGPAFHMASAVIRDGGLPKPTMLRPRWHPGVLLLSAGSCRSPASHSSVPATLLAAGRCRPNRQPPAVPVPPGF